MQKSQERQGLGTMTGGDHSMSGPQPECGPRSLGDSDTSGRVCVGGARPARKSPGCGEAIHPERDPSLPAIQPGL